MSGNQKKPHAFTSKERDPRCSTMGHGGRDCEKRKEKNEIQVYFEGVKRGQGAKMGKTCGKERRHNLPMREKKMEKID